VIGVMVSIYYANSMEIELKKQTTITPEKVSYTLRKTKKLAPKWMN
jgi:hypothetical protein